MRRMAAAVSCPNTAPANHFGIAICNIWYYLSGMTTLTLKVTETLAEQLQRVASQRRLPKSQIVREALEAALRHDRVHSTPSAHDLMKRGCGVVKGGPRDLASNPKHLAGFGR